MTRGARKAGKILRRCVSVKAPGRHRVKCTSATEIYSPKRRRQGSEGDYAKIEKFTASTNQIESAQIEKLTTSANQIESAQVGMVVRPSTHERLKALHQKKRELHKKRAGQVVRYKVSAEVHAK